MPWIGAAGPNGHRAACLLRGGCSPDWMGWGWARADPGFLGDGSGPAEAQTEDRGWSRFGGAGPDGDSGLFWRASFEDQPRTTPDLRKLTGLGPLDQPDRRTAPPCCCPRQLVRGEAASNGESRLRTRLDDQRRSRLEGLFQRTIASTFVGLVAAAGLAGLRHQNLAAIRESGHSIGEYFAQDLLSEPPSSARRRAFFPRKLWTSWRFPGGW